MLKKVASVFCALWALCFAAPASADWYEASTDNFVIYADDSEKDIRKFAENLERYHSAMERLTGRQVEKPSPSNRVTIFAVGGSRAIKDLSGSSQVAGFYVPRAGASRAFVQDIRNVTGRYPHFSMTVLLHEYAHHFLISQSRFAMPRWYNEGAAEFFASASFDSDGSVWIGRPAQHRAGELFYLDEIKVPDILAYGQQEERDGNRSDAFYGRSWLLYHYLTFSDERRDQLEGYARAIMGGADSLEAGKMAFGDLDQLQDEVDHYLERKRRLSAFKLPPDWLETGTIILRQLPRGEAEMMDVRIRSQRGVNAEEAAELVVEARKIAAEYPNDPGVLTALAETEFDAGNDDAAIAAADAALAIDPGRANAYVQKGFALFRKARDAEDRDAAFEAAMAPFAQLNARENDHPMPLIFYYRSYANRGIEPPENARHALERAAQLAPFDQGLWFDVAMMQMQEGKISLARSSLQPMANDPHGGRQAGFAKLYIAAIADSEDGEPFDPGQVIETPRIERSTSSDEADQAPETPASAD